MKQTKNRRPAAPTRSTDLSRSLSDVRHAVNKLTQTDTPLELLDQLSQLRGALNKAIDRTIITGREAGLSFADIAGPLRVSPQAIAQRHAALKST